MNPLATEATRSKSSLRHSHSFPNQTGHGGKESRARVKVGLLPIIGGVYKRWAWVTIIVIIVRRGAFTVRPGVQIASEHNDATNLPFPVRKAQG